MIPKGGHRIGWLLVLAAAIVAVTLPEVRSQQPSGQEQSIKVQGENATKPAEDANRSAMPGSDQNSNPEANAQHSDEREGGWTGWAKNPITLFTFLLTAFTAVLALSTGLLWWETRNLRRLADSQSEDMRLSVGIAQRSAEAAEKSAKIAEDTLIATQRPWVTVDIGVGGPLEYNVNGANFTFR